MEAGVTRSTVDVLALRYQKINTTVSILSEEVHVFQKLPLNTKTRLQGLSRCDIP